MDEKKQHGVVASSHEYAIYDQVNKPAYQLAEHLDGEDQFDDDFVIKTVDLGKALRGNARDRAQFAGELGAAMQEIGFAILDGHGVDPELFVEAGRWVEELFTSVPLEDKLRFRAARHGSVSEGYFPIQETSAIHPDLVEGWVFGRRAFDLDGDPAFDPAALWPRPDFEPRFRRLVAAELPLFQPILSAILTYLGCDEAFIGKYESAFGRKVAATYRANHGSEPDKGGLVILRGRLWKTMRYSDIRDLHAGAAAYARTRDYFGTVA